MDTTKELPAVLSLCTGYGGIERGLELAGFKHRVVAHVEIEAFAIANLVSKMEEGRLHPAPIWSNLKTLPLDCFRGRVYILTGGYPCQPFSAAGQRKGKDDPRHLWPYIFDIIKAVKPFRCFFENVEGHVSLGLREVISDLESLGYQTTWGIFSAAEVGAPHQRKRVFIMADSLGMRELQQERGLENIGGRAAHSSQQVADSTGQRYGTGREKRDIHQAYGGSVRECISEPAFSSACDGGEELADSFGERRCSGYSERKDAANAWEPPRCNEHGGWDIEPDVGRVANGITNRIDRIRLLGNGVVPQTAALAWVTLEKELEKAGRGNEPGRLE